MSRMNKPVSIVDTPNPFVGNCPPAYIPAGYPSQECIPEICLTHTEREEGEPFNPVPPESALLPDCIVISSGEGLGTELTLTGTEYEGTNAIAEIDPSGTWCLSINGSKFVEASRGDLPIGAFISATGESISVVPCENFAGGTGLLPTCVRLVFTDVNDIPPQDFNVDATGVSFIGEFGGGSITRQGDEWLLMVNGETLVGGTNANDPTGQYVGGGSCALVKECDAFSQPLPQTLQITLADEETIEGIQWSFNGVEYDSSTAAASALTYAIGAGWTFVVDSDGDLTTTVDQSSYTKIGDDALNPDDPSGIYSNGVDQLVVSIV